MQNYSTFIKPNQQKVKHQEAAHNNIEIFYTNTSETVPKFVKKLCRK